MGDVQGPLPLGSLKKPAKKKKYQPPSANFTRGAVGKLWRQARAEFLKTQEHEDTPDWPYRCNVCAKWLAKDEVQVDHIIKRSIAPHLRYEPSNFQCICDPCHKEKDGGMRVRL